MAFVSVAALSGWLGENPVDPTARANFPAFLLTCGEGHTAYGYSDDLGNITVGDGNLLASYGAFADLDWRNQDGTSASPTQVHSAWTSLQGAAAIVKAAGPKQWPGGSAYAKLTTIRATEASIDALIQARIDQFEATLRTYWPGWDAAPGPAQEALMRICWAVGPGRLDVHWPSYWPKLHAAWVAGDWAACALECAIPALDSTEPGANAAEAALFLSCVQPASGGQS